MRKRVWPILIPIALILGWQLLVPPVIGLADQGDYARVIGHFDFGPEAKGFPQRYYSFLNRIYVRDPFFRQPQMEMLTSEYLFTGLAVALSLSGRLDIRVVGVIHMAVFLLASYFLLKSSRWWGVFLILFFCDTGYVCYFNSFFTEPASYLFLFLLVAVWLRLDRSWALGVFTALGILWIAAKPQNFLPGLLLAAYALRFWNGRRKYAATCSLLLAGMSIFIYADMPQTLKAAPAYDVLFMRILPQSVNPAADLRSFGMDPGLVRYSGSGAFSPHTAFSQPGFPVYLLAHADSFKLVMFQFTHPALLYRAIRDMLPRSVSLRAEYSGNYERNAGHPPGAHSSAFALWSAFRENWLARVAWLPLVFLILSAPVAFRLALRANDRRTRLLAECYGMLVLMALSSFLTAAVGDTWDVVKHMFLYNLLTDICLAITLMWLTARVSRSGKNFRGSRSLPR